MPEDGLAGFEFADEEERLGGCDPGLELGRLEKPRLAPGIVSYRYLGGVNRRL